MESKIVPLEFLAGIGGILCHGCFDLLHVGHVRYLQWASRLRDASQKTSTLVVTLTADAYFPKYKGESRPAFPQDIRAECLAALQCVDYVAIVNEPTGVLAINTIKPRIYAKGWEAKGVIPFEVAATEFHGGHVAYMEKESESGQMYSSGRILSGEYLKSRNGAGSRPRGIGEGDIGVE